MKPEDVFKMIKQGKMRPGGMKPPGMGHPYDGMGPLPAAPEMSADQYKLQACLSEVNAILRKYGCRLIPQIHLDPVAGVRGVCAIDFVEPRAKMGPAPGLGNEEEVAAAREEEEGYQREEDERAAKARIEALRADSLKAPESSPDIPDKEA